MEGFEVTLVAAHDVKARLVGPYFRSERKFFAKRIEGKMLFDRAPLLESAIRRQDEGGARKPRQKHGDAVGPVGDRIYSHEKSLPCAD
ncbi:hypothetical protein D9M68_492790 [compost metagenome]